MGATQLAMTRRQRAPADLPRWSERAATLCELLVVIALQLALLTHVRDALDLHWWDEAIYYGQGADLWRGRIDGHFFAWAPGLSFAYALLDRLPLAGRLPPDAMVLCCALASSVAAWWALRALLPKLVAMFAGCWWAAMVPPVMSAGAMLQTDVYLFVAALQLVALGCIARGRHGTALALLAFAALTRPEMAFFTVIYGASAVWLAWRRRGPSRAVAALTLAAGLALSAMHLALPDARDRSWLVFRQHYAMGLAEREAGKEAANLAHADPDPWVARSFGAASSIAQAAAANPAAFAEHVSANLRALPAPLAALCTSPFAHAPAVRALFLGMIALLIAVGAWRRRLAPAPLATAHARAAWMFLLAGLIAIPLAALVWPRRELLLGVLPLLLALAGGYAAAAFPARAPASAAAAAGAGAGAGAPAGAWRCAIAAAALLLVLFAPRPFGPLVPRIHEMRKALELVLRNGLAPGSKLLAYNAENVLRYAQLPGVHALDVVPLCGLSGAPHASLAAAVDATDPDWFMVTQTLLQFPRLDAEVLAEVVRDRWELQDLTPVAMLLRRVR
jgi:hypothetical protein